jgi:hypothetical protein
VSRLTVFLARLIGLFITIVGLSLGLHKQESVATITAIVHAPDQLLVIGLIALVAGLAMVLRHNIWSGGALPIVITLFGWIILLRAALLLFLSSETLARLLRAIHFDDVFYVYISVVVVIGAWLTYAGFTSRMPAGEPARS